MNYRVFMVRRRAYGVARGSPALLEGGGMPSW